MSNYWRVRCRTSGEATLKDVTDRARQIAEFSGTDISISVGWPDEPLDKDWFRKHVEHEILPYSEYGYYSGESREKK